MKKLTFILSIVFMVSCNMHSPRKVAETMLKLSKKGDFPNKVYTTEFEHNNSFDSDIFVKDLIPVYGKDSRNMADKIAEQGIQLPNGIKSFEFIQEVKQDSITVRTVSPLQIINEIWLSEDMKSYYVEHCNGVIDYENKFIEYDVSRKAARTILVYNVKINGLNKHYIFSMINYFDEWKIYGITPDL